MCSASDRYHAPTGTNWLEAAKNRRQPALSRTILLKTAEDGSERGK